MRYVFSFLMIAALSWINSLFAVDAQSVNKVVPSVKAGVIPAVSEHYKVKPAYYDFNTMPIDQKSSAVGLRFAMGTHTTMIRWYLKKVGTTLPLHFHPNEQINFVEQGKIEVHSQGDAYTLTKGQVVIFPPNVPHEFVALADNTVLVDIQTPARQEFINGEFDKAAKVIFR